MKKLLVFIIALVLVLSIGGCQNPPQDTLEDTELEQRVTTLEGQVAELEGILVDLEVIEGLNGQKEYYLPQETQTTFAQTVSAGYIELLGDELDKTKAPSYVLDANGDYVPFDDVIDLLFTKYFGEKATVTNALIGFQIKIVLNTNDISQEEYMARLIMLINELSLYDFYIIGGSELYIQSYWEATSYIKIPIQTLRSSFITITPEVIYTGTYEIQLSNVSYDNISVQTLYDEYMASGLYGGYVLDYK